jgi:hypothetical protein
MMICITIGYTRLLLGAHTLNQLIFGWLIGIWVALNFYFLLRDLVLEHVENLLKGGMLESDVSKYALKSSLIFAVGIAFQSFLFSTLNNVVTKASSLRS